MTLANAATTTSAAAAVSGVPAINLIPKARAERSRVKRRLRMWGVVCAAYAGILGIALGFSYLRWSPMVGDVGAELAKADEQVRALQSARAKEQAALGEVGRKLASARALLARPDWSNLLAILSGALGNDVVLSDVELQLVQEQPAAPAVQNTAAVAAAAAVGPDGKPAEKVLPPPVGKWYLKASGFGKTPGAVSQYVLRLEGLGLFDRVTLVRTNREPVRDTDATNFQVECPLKGQGRVSR